MSASRLHQQVAHEVVVRRLWAPGDRVAVAVSGGRDSVCLLDLLVRSSGQHGGELIVSTIAHGMRPDAEEDVALVQALARRYGLPCVVHRAALGPGASEAEGRHVRRAAWEALDVARIALAHHQTDQAETALLGLLRGGGTLGQAGMAWQSGRLVRPLLGVSAEALAAWARSRGCIWREDSSNSSPRFLRNRVRRELLPLLEAMRQGAVPAIARGAGHAAEDAAYLDALAEACEPWNGEGWPSRWVAEGPAPLVRRRLLARVAVSSGQVDAIVEAARRGGGRVAVSELVAVVVDAGVVRIVESTSSSVGP